MLALSNPKLNDRETFQLPRNRHWVISVKDKEFLVAEMVNMTGATNLTVLIVGNVKAWETEGRPLPVTSQFAYAHMDEITDELLDNLRPDIVLSSVFTAEFDALDLAEVLCNAGYRGRYRALAPRLPNPDLVRQEVRAICKNIDFDVLIIDQATQLRMN